ncbi:MAG TPA: nucleotide sugar dehydrogenase [Nitrospirales bacterium]|nr:nucleotide sugar dehydrogenase [Nitrospirales bacterium]
MNDLLSKIEEKTANIAVIGLGYVGLPLAVDFAKAGFHVVGIDKNQARANAVDNGRNYIGDVSDDDLKTVTKNGRLTGTTDFSVLQQTDAICICVPTPLSKTKDPDVSFILHATDAVHQHLRFQQLICLESTTYPGTTRELVLPRLSGTGLTVGKDFFLSFSPERIDPGNAHFKLKNTPKVIGGTTPACLKLSEALYGNIVDHVIPVSSTEAAEMVKLLENTFRSVNIGLVNEMAIMAQKLGLDVWEVIHAASTKPYGFMPFYPGPGLGGHCIPVDPHYLAWKLKTLNYKARFIEMAGEINAAMPQYVVDLIVGGLNQNKKSVNGSNILVLGLSYKKDIADTRESPALDIITILKTQGANISWNDPYVSDYPTTPAPTFVKNLTPSALSATDCVVIVTDHSSYDWASIVANATLVIDTRNATKDVQCPSGRVLKL